LLPAAKDKTCVLTSYTLY